MEIDWPYRVLLTGEQIQSSLWGKSAYFFPGPAWLVSLKWSRHWLKYKSNVAHNVSIAYKTLSPNGLYWCIAKLLFSYLNQSHQFFTEQIRFLMFVVKCICGHGRAFLIGKPFKSIFIKNKKMLQTLIYTFFSHNILHPTYNVV